MPEPTSNIIPSNNKILLLLTANAVKDPAFVESITTKFKHNDANNEIHRHVLDRVASGAAKLPESFFTNIYYLPISAKEQEEPFTQPAVLDTLFKAVASEGTLHTIQLLASDKEETVVTPKMITAAIVAGFLQSSDKLAFTKPKQALAPTATLLSRRQRPASTTTDLAVSLDTNDSVAPKKKLPIFKRKQPTAAAATAPTAVASVAVKRPADSISSGVVKLSLSDDFDDDDSFDDDNLIDENELLVEASKMLSKPIVLPPKCDPGPGKRRRRACKDCTCGLREQEIEEEEEQRKKQDAVILNLDGDDDDYAIDFTVPVGKAVGSCGSCALGDAFRCDSCPYLGLPPFKPGEIINITAIKNDL